MHAEGIVQSECKWTGTIILFSLSSTVNSSLLQNRDLDTNWSQMVSKKHNHCKWLGPQWLPPKSDPTGSHRVRTSSSYTDIIPISQLAGTEDQRSWTVLKRASFVISDKQESRSRFLQTFTQTKSTAICACLPSPFPSSMHHHNNPHIWP